MRILVVDDSVDIATSLADLLHLEGYICDKANNYKAAQILLAAGEYDLLIFDYLMPRMNGVELLKYCRGRGIKARAIILSAVASERLGTVADEIRLENLNPAMVLGKPCDPETLLQLISAWANPT